MTRDDLDLVDEYVLGLIEGADRAAFELRLEEEPDLRAAVARSRDRFVELDLTAPALALDEALWTPVARLKGEVGRTIGRGDTPPAPPANLPHAPPGRVRGYFRTAAAAGIGLMIGAGLSFTTLQPDPIVLTVLVDAAGAPLAVVEDFGRMEARVRFVADVAVPEGRQMQVWTLPSPETGPVSLGLLRGPAGQVLRGPDLPRPAEGQLYEITLEQPGGSPTGRPTGPVVAKGFAAAQEDI
jgi:anti-sigma-K factor RskA